MMPAMLPVVLAVIVMVVGLNVWSRSLERDGEWHDHTRWGKHVMRRWRGGEWQYREPTVEEYNQHVTDSSI